MIKLLFVIITFYSLFSFSAGGGAHGVPSFVHWQAINLIILFGGLFYFLKDPVKSFFSQRRSSYIEAKNKAKKAREDAEKAREDIKLKLFKIENSKKEMIETAEKNAIKEFEAIVLAAKQRAESLKKSSELQMAMELNSAKDRLLAEMVEKSLELSKTNLKTAVKEEEKNKLQQKFIEKIQVVSHV